MSRQSEFRRTYPDIYVELCSFFPDFDYRTCVGARNIICRMDSGAENKVGHQQRAFSTWWGIETCGPMDLGLDIGAHRGLTPFCIHIDKFYDGVHQHPFYGGVAGADVVADAVSLNTIFPPSTFPFIGSNHSLEHMPVPGDPGTIALLKDWMALLRPGGVLAMVVPDNDWWNVMAADRDHKNAWGARDFRARVLDKVLAETGAALLEYDTLDNHYSFNVVIRKS